MTCFRGKEAAFTHAHAGFAPMDVVPCGNNGADYWWYYDGVTDAAINIETGDIISRPETDEMFNIS